jgi:acyl-CoA dehydrogenase
LKRLLFDDTHAAFRARVHAFYAERLVPEYANGECDGAPPRQVWTAAGELGLLGMQAPAEYGGGGQDSFLFNVILTEESHHMGVAFGGLRMHTDIAMPFFLRVANAEQRSRWLPRLVSGDAIGALTTSQVGGGCDDKAMTLRAVRDGRNYIVYGSKTVVSEAAAADLIVTAVSTDSAAGRDGLSLLVIDTDSPRLTRDQWPGKTSPNTPGLAQLTFDDVVVPAENLLGEEGRGFGYLTANMAQERLSIAVNRQASAVKALRDTIEDIRRPKTFGDTAPLFHNTAFEIATCATDVEAGQSLLDRALVAHDDGELSAADAAMVKLFCAEMQRRVVGRCRQLHGSNRDTTGRHPIAALYVDARVSPSYGASAEVMKAVIAQALGI